ncbi:MAG: hypothetical protein ACREMZ_03875 [Gemmatimonadales bacterium]
MTGHFAALVSSLALKGCWFTTLLAQGAGGSVGNTVGDTVWLSRTVGVPSGHAIRPADWEPADDFELLGRARVTVFGDSARVEYPVVFWRPGSHRVEVPGPLLLGPGGTVDSVAGARVRIEITSVLPPAPADSQPPPQPPAALVESRAVTLAPLLTLWAIAAALLLPAHLWWRRRGTPTRAQPLSIRPETLEPPLARWADAGEYRAVAAVSAARLRAVVAERVAAAHPGLDTERVLAELAAACPEWPLQELGDLLRALDDARFGLTPSQEALELSRSSSDLRDRLSRAAA